MVKNGNSDGMATSQDPLAWRRQFCRGQWNEQEGEGDRRKGIVAMSSVVPRQPPRLKDWDERWRQKLLTKLSWMTREGRDDPRPKQDWTCSSFRSMKGLPNGKKDSRFIVYFRFSSRHFRNLTLWLVLLKGNFNLPSDTNAKTLAGTPLPSYTFIAPKKMMIPASGIVPK